MEFTSTMSTYYVDMVDISELVDKCKEVEKNNV